MDVPFDETIDHLARPDDLDDLDAPDDMPSSSDPIASENRFVVEIDEESITISNRPNRREAIIAALERLPDEQFFVGGDTMTIVCTRIR